MAGLSDRIDPLAWCSSTRPGQDQHGAARDGRAWPAPRGQGARRPLDDHDLPRRLGARPARCAVADRRSINGETFRLYIDEVLLPTSVPATSRMDNLGSHKARTVRGAHPLRRRQALLPAQVLGRPEPIENTSPSSSTAAKGRSKNTRSLYSASPRSCPQQRQPNAQTSSLRLIGKDESSPLDRSWWRRLAVTGEAFFFRGGAPVPGQPRAHQQSGR